jgi:predicted hotdog family 3-hydroxylacyl-ACP dehydratase
MAPSEKINIPQKPPMVMVDRLLPSPEGIVRTGFLIRPDNVLFHQGHLTEAGLIENMAQTAAAGTGMRPAREGEFPPVGYIGGIRNLKIFSYPVAWQEITTTVQILHEVSEASVVKATVFLGDTLIASAELKIFLIR